MSEKQTFGAYIQQNLAGYFPTLGARIRAALGLLEAYEKDAASRGKGRLCPCTAFLSPETVSLYEGEGVALPEIDFSGKGNGDWQNAPYTNFAYGTPHLFEDHRHRPTKNKDMEQAVSDVDAAIILAKLAFYAVFGFHPMCGRQYYRFLPEEDSAAQERGFFADSPRFIFDIEGNNGVEPQKNNRFVNGYTLHENGFVLWNGIHPEQREVFLDAFAGKYGWKEFISEWRSRYLCDLSQTKAPCGAFIKALVFPRYGALLLSELGVSFDKIRCYGFSSEKGAAAKCADCYAKCKVRGEVKIASFATFKLRVRGGTAEELTLYDGKKICPADFSKSEDRAPMFAAVLSPKGDLFGLRYLRKEPLTATCEGKSRTYREKEVLALLAGMEIPVENCALFVPAPPKPEPKPEPEPVVQPEPVAQPEPVVPPEPEPQPRTVQKEVVLQAYEQKPEPLPPSKPEVKSEIKPEVKPEVKPVPAPQAGPAQERLTMQSGRVVEFVGSPDRYTADGGSRHHQKAPYRCDVYDVRDVSDGKFYRLQVYRDARLGLMRQVELKVDLSKQVSPVFLLPIDTAAPAQGRFKDRFCVLNPDIWRSNPASLWAVLQGQKIGLRDARPAAWELARALNGLHGLQYTFGGVMEDTAVYIGTEAGSIHLNKCSRIAILTGATSATDGAPKFTAPEVLRGAPSDPYSDDYVLAVILFEIFMNVHPFMGKLADGRYRNGDLPFLFDPLYPDNKPVGSLRETEALAERWRALPDGIRLLFRNAFVYETSRRWDEVDERRKKRPSAYEWMKTIESWMRLEP